MENPKERIEDILKRNPYLDAKESFFASSGENDWQAIKRLCYFLYRHHKVLPIILVDEYDTSHSMVSTLCTTFSALI
jgi:hypothetical protein